MSIIQEIQSWSKKALSAWQQDAIARLYANRTLTPADIDDLYALAKAEAGIPDPENRQPKALQDAEVAPAPNPSRLVQIVGVKNVQHVNALAAGERLPIAATGLTVIYGENGAGKSGYSRIFKRACRARDQSESILPDAKMDPKAAGVAQAVFQTIIDGKAEDLAWNDKSESPEPLSDVAIFDTHCARAYIDNQGDFAYVPYGLDILEGLVTVCNQLKAKGLQERAANTPTDVAYATLTHEQTKVAEALKNIPAQTKPEHIEALAAMSEADQARLALLTKTLAEADPKQKAQTLRQKALRVSGLKDRITAAIAIVSDDKVNELSALIAKSKAAKNAAELAATKFKQVPGQLPGTGGDEWKVLFEAAREFAKISHAGSEFPDLPEDSACPLCQNPLGADGSERLIRFETFVQQAVETAAKEARDVAATAYRTIQEATLDLLLDDALKEELQEIDAALAGACDTLQTELKARQKATIGAAGEKLPWGDIPKLSENPGAALDAHVLAFQDQAKALDATADEKAKAAMTAEHLELDARRRLEEIKAAVLEVLEKHSYCDKLKNCMTGMDTRAISKKATDLSQTMASQELADALTEELKLLKVHELKVVMKPESPGGRTQFKLTLQLPGGKSPAAILSEGEQRAIAIASFLAEMRLGKGRGGIVFDDPVSSLDHRRRWELAERLAKESLVRQVIVFTHDIYFLCILEQKAEEAGTTLEKNYIRKTPAGFGVPADELPFDVLGTKDRVARLRRKVEEVRAAQTAGDDDGHRKLTSEAYGELRLAWERCIEEVLFNEAVQRFGEGVLTKRLQQVIVTDDDYKAIDAGMSKSSKFEHDAATRVGRLPIPDPDELRNDIETLDAWRNVIVKRRDQVRANR